MSKGRIIGLITDLFFSVRAADVLRHLGYEAQIVERGSDLQAALATAQPDLVLIDLGEPPELWEPAIRMLKSDHPHIPLLAFGSHLDTSRQKLARELGCDRIVANSKLQSSLPELVEATLAKARAAQQES